MGWIGKLKQGLKKTSSSISQNISQIFTHRKLDNEALESLEELLITSDMGVEIANEIIEELSREKFDKQVTDLEIKEFLSTKIAEILEPVAKPLEVKGNPHVILVCGVNGNGKTTTIGKLAHRFKKEGKKVVLGACDTFRAAAVEQLEVWADRAECVIVKGEPQSDPASVAYKAFSKAKEDGADVCIIDTAGRLHNKSGLMEELAKCKRVLKKIEQDAPHDILLVLDATTGQNALRQVETFQEIIGITGLIITKLDGSAKAGIVPAIARKFKIPVHAIGVGEGIDELNEFSPSDFSKLLVGVE